MSAAHMIKSGVEQPVISALLILRSYIQLDYRGKRSRRKYWRYIA